MTAGVSSTGQAPAADELRGLARFGVRTLLGLTAVIVGALPLLLLLHLVQDRRAPLAALDGDVAARLNAELAGRPGAVRALEVVTEGGGTGTAVYALVLATAWLLVRRQRRLAAYVTVTGLGLAVLVPVSKALVGRERPQVLLPLVDLPTNASFPSGHAMTSMVTWTVLLLLVLPRTPRLWRRRLVGAVVLLVLAVGFSRLALGVHFVTDVAAGWALGAAWLLVTTAAFRGWQHEQGRPTPQVVDGLTGTPHADRLRASLAVLPLHAQGRTALLLALSWVALFVVLVVIGTLLTHVLDTSAVGRFDRWAVRAVLELRTPTRTDVSEWSTLCRAAGASR